MEGGEPTPRKGVAKSPDGDTLALKYVVASVWPGIRDTYSSLIATQMERDRAY